MLGSDIDQRCFRKHSLVHLVINESMTAAQGTILNRISVTSLLFKLAIHFALGDWNLGPVSLGL